MKKHIKICILGMMLFILTGCMKVNTTIDIKSDLSMEMNVDYLMDESTISQYYGTSEVAIAQMKDQLKKQNEDLDITKIKPLSKTIDGKEWFGITYSMVYEKGNKKTMVHEEEVDGVDSIVFTIPLNESLVGQDAYDSSSIAAMKAKGVELTIVVNMPANATSNYGVVNGKTVTIDLLELQSSGFHKNIVVTSAKSEFPLGLVLGGIGAVVIIGAIVLVLRKKKPNSVPVEVSPMNETVSSQSAETTQKNTDVNQNHDESVKEVIQETSVDESVEEKLEVTQEVIEVSEEHDEPVKEVIQEETIEMKDEIETEKIQTDDQKRFCPNCGKPVGDVMFCPNCGFQLK